jgi:hypothetical protein
MWRMLVVVESSAFRRRLGRLQSAMWSLRYRAGPSLALLMFCALGACGNGDSSTNGQRTGVDTTHGPTTPPYYNVDSLGVPKFVNTIYIDLSQLDSTGTPVVFQISKFRSSAGHDYSDSVERCRSMKHYFSFPDRATKLYFPVTGTIVGVNSDTMWGGISIQSDAQPAFVFTVFHPVLARLFVQGEHVTEGQFMGTHTGNWTSSDIAVLVNPGSNPGRPHGGPDGRLVSYFETLTDNAFLPFNNRDINSPADLIISRAERDARTLHVGLHRAGDHPSRRAAAGARVPPKALYARRARPRSAQGPGPAADGLAVGVNVADSGLASPLLHP